MAAPGSTEETILNPKIGIDQATTTSDGSRLRDDIVPALSGMGVLGEPPSDWGHRTAPMTIEFIANADR